LRFPLLERSKSRGVVYTSGVDEDSRLRYSEVVDSVSENGRGAARGRSLLHTVDRSARWRGRAGAAAATPCPAGRRSEGRRRWAAGSRAGAGTRHRRPSSNATTADSASRRASTPCRRVHRRRRRRSCSSSASRVALRSSAHTANTHTHTTVQLSLASLRGRLIEYQLRLGVTAGMSPLPGGR